MAVYSMTGYATAQLNVGELSPGWHDYQVRTEPDDPSEEATVVSGRVLVPDPSVGVAVVSDLDDTVIKTGLGEGIVALRRTLFGQAETRVCVEKLAHGFRRVSDVCQPAVEIVKVFKRQPVNNPTRRGRVIAAVARRDWLIGLCPAGFTNDPGVDAANQIRTTRSLN